MDETKKHLRGAGGKLSFFNPNTHRKENAEILRIDERAKGAWIAEGKDSQGRPLRQFVKRGTAK